MTTDRITARLVEFSRFARDNGFAVGLKETMSALDAAATVGLADRCAFKWALQAVLCSSREEWGRFDVLFERFWKNASFKQQTGEDRTVRASQIKKNFQPTNLFEEMNPGRPWMVSSRDERLASDEPDNGKIVSGASRQERLERTDFSKLNEDDLVALDQLSLRLLRQMSLRLSRKIKAARCGSRVDLRRTIRSNLTRGGDPIDLKYSGKKRQQPRLAILLDVSGSMDIYSRFLLKFLYVLQKHFARVHPFIFSTKLTSIADAMLAEALPEVLRRLSQTTAGWSGGTRIGDSIVEFSRRHSKLLSRETVFLILSDGLDTGDPEVLAAGLRSIKSRVRRIMWLNPLLGLDNYQPLTRGMKAALPHVDVFAPCHNLKALLELERHLRSSSVY